jgi:hypothetical protein
MLRTRLAAPFGPMSDNTFRPHGTKVDVADRDEPAELLAATPRDETLRCRARKLSSGACLTS